MKKLSKITESIWSDIQDRSAGDTVRKEDDINLMSIEDFCGYLNDNYISEDGYNRTYRIYYVSKVLSIAVLMGNSYEFYSIKYDYGHNMIYLNDEIEDFVPELCQKLKNNFKVVKNRVGDSYTKFIIYPSDGSECTNRFFVDVLDFIIKNGDKKRVILTKQNLNESIWSDIQDRSSGDTIREEEVGKYITIDGVKWVLSKDFWDLGDEYNDENSDEWRCFAFNKPKDGTKIIRGNGEDTGVFGYDKWDIGEDEYDVYVLKGYIDYSKEELVENAMDSYYLDNSDYIVQGILKKYVTDVFENYMSDYAKFWIYELMNTDVDKNMVIAYCEGTDYSEIDAIADEFDNIYDARMFLYPEIEGWYEGLEKELTEAYEKAGWVKSKSYEPDWNNSDIPGGVMGLCFVKLTDD